MFSVSPEVKKERLTVNCFYEPYPYVVTHNAVVLEDTNGNSKMRNTAHIKKFVEPGTIKMKKSNPSSQPEVPNQTVDPARCNQPETTASQTGVCAARGGPPEQLTRFPVDCVTTSWYETSQK